MEWVNAEGLWTLKFDLVVTLALASIVLFIGYALQERFRPLARTSIPAPAIGGLLFALLVLALRSRGTLGMTLDTTLRTPLQTAFFTTIGLGATLSLLRAGGWRMGFFWLIASVTAIVQNIIGIGLALALGAPAALGIICGALTLTGGPATGLAQADKFEQLGIGGASALIIAAATFGIFASSLVGNPLATILIKRFHLARDRGAASVANTIEQGARVSARTGEREGASRDVRRQREDAETGEENIIADIANEAGEGQEAAPLSVLEDEAVEKHEPLTGYVLLRNLAIILAVMGVGALLSQELTRLSSVLPGYFAWAPKLATFVESLLRLPGYIGAMIVAAVVRNLDDQFRWVKINPRAVEALGAIALALFLAIALMDLKLWQLAGLALPMLVILCVQIVVMLVYATAVTFVLMGRDYEAAVTASGHVGFGLGITPNAVANMEALTARFAPAPRSFLIVPVVGAFFIDISNSIIINVSANLLR